MISVKYAILGTLILGVAGAGAYYKYQYEQSIEALTEVTLARDSAVNQLNLLAENYADQVKRVNDYQERLSTLSRANSKISSQLDAYKSRVQSMSAPEAEKESNIKTESILKELRK